MASPGLLSHGTCHILLTQSLLLPSGWSPPDLPRRSSGWMRSTIVWHMIPFDPRRRQAAVQEDSAAGLMAAEVVDRSARIGHTHWQAGALQKALQQ